MIPKSSSQRAQRMLSDFSNVETLKWVGVALVIHVVLIGGQSMVSWMRGGEAQADAQAQATTQPASQPATQPAVATKPAAAATAAPADKTDGGDDKVPDDRKNSKYLEKLTEKTEPSKAPTQPVRHGLELDE